MLRVQERHLLFLKQEKEAYGQQSMFFKLPGMKTLAGGKGAGHTSSIYSSSESSEEGTIIKCLLFFSTLSNLSESQLATDEVI